MNEHTQTNELDPLINLLFGDGLQNSLPRIAEILMNAAMMLERENHIGAATSAESSEMATPTASSPACSIPESEP